eukprot:1087295-Amphidinium_carterae.4
MSWTLSANAGFDLADGNQRPGEHQPPPSLKERFKPVVSPIAGPFPHQPETTKSTPASSGRFYFCWRPINASTLSSKDSPAGASRARTASLGAMAVSTESFFLASV